MPAVLAAAEVSAAHRILDVATGPGEAASMALSQVGPSGLVVGSDISVEMLSVAATRLADRRFRAVAADGQALPFADYRLLSGTAFEKTRQRSATLVLLLRGIAKGESTARLARELGMSRQQELTLRQRVQTNLNDTAPSELLAGTIFEADELYQNAGEKKYTPSRSS